MIKLHSLAGIAQVSIDKKNLFTVLKDVNDPGLSRGVFQVKDGLAKKIKRKKINANYSKRQMTAIKSTYFLPFDFLSNVSNFSVVSIFSFSSNMGKCSEGKASLMSQLFLPVFKKSESWKCLWQIRSLFFNSLMPKRFCQASLIIGSFGDLANPEIDLVLHIGTTHFWRQFFC